MSAVGSLGRGVVTIYEGFLEKVNLVGCKDQVTWRVSRNEPRGSFLSFNFELPSSLSA